MGSGVRISGTDTPDGTGGCGHVLYPTPAVGIRTVTGRQQRQLDAWLTILCHALLPIMPVIVANRVGFEPSPLGANGGNAG